MLATCAETDLRRIIEGIGTPTFVIDARKDRSFRQIGENQRSTAFAAALSADFSDHCLACLDTGEAVEFDRDFLDDGRARSARITLVPLFDETGGVARLLGTATDVSARRAAEREAERTRALYQGVLDEQQDLISRFLPDTTLTYVNDAYARLLGVPPEAILGQRFADALTPSDRARVTALFDHQGEVVEGEPIELINENAVVTPSGEQRWIRWRNVALTDENGRIVGYQSVGTDITERKLAEEGMRTAQRSLREVIDSISEGFALYDADDRLVLYNENFAANTPHLDAFDTPTGATFEDILRAGLDSRQLLDGRAIANREAWIAERVAAHRFPPDTPAEQRLADGRHFRVSERRTRDGGVVCIQTDITRLREQEAKIRESERRLKVILDTAADAIITIDGRGTVRDFNKAAEAIFGYPADEVIGRSIEMLMSVDMAATHQGFIDAHVATGVNRIIGVGREVQGRRSDGKLVDLDLAISAVAGGDSLFTGILRDITDRKRTQAALVESEQRMRLLADSATDIISLHAPDTTMIYVSPSCQAQLGIEPNDMIGRRLEEFVHPDDLPVAELTRSGERVGPAGSAVFRLRHRDGRWLWFESVSGRLEGTRDHGAGILTSMREVTERIRYEQELRDASDRLAAQAVELRKLAVDLDVARRIAEQASDAKSQFLAMMSHELRTPMTGVMGMVDLLNGTPLSDEQRGYVRTLGASAGILLTILNDVLDFSKIEAGHLLIEEIDFDLRRIVDDVLQLFSGRAVEKGVTLTADIPADAPRVVRGDPTRLRQVLFNLVGNALKFTEAGGIQVRLAGHRTDGADDGVSLRFEVSDSGMGLTEEQRSRLFEAFVQADTTTTRRFGGTGLGLAICKRLVEAMGGEIGVESAPGAGSTFHFTVRLIMGHAEPPPAKLVMTLPASAKRGVRILLAEDNEVNRLLVVKMLERLGHTATAVEDGRAAVEAARHGGYDMILMDMQMPVLDGASATREIRRFPGAAGRVPIVALTADVASGNRQRHLEAGLDGYFTKPIDWTILASAIDALTGEADGAEDGGARSPVSATPNMACADAAPGTDLLVRLPLVDTGRLEELRASIGDSYDLMMQMFPESVREELETLRAGLLAGDAVTSRRAAHTLKGVAASFGATRIQAIAHMLEDTSHSPEYSAQLLNSLEAALAATLDALTPIT
jgi:PAS domain S-box-containing protein